jgi:glutathione transport system permease protein
MLKYFLHRFLEIIPILFIISILIFLFVHLIPGDPARLILGEEATAIDLKLTREKLGLDKPLLTQYGIFIGNLLRGDLGISMAADRPIMDILKRKFPPTLYLSLISMVWAVILGLVIGTISAVKRGKWQDYLGMFTAVSGISIPNFWLGLLLMEFFCVRLGWLPTMGYGNWKNFILPSLTLGAGIAAVIARFSRSSLMEVLREDYIRTARAKGLKEMVVLNRHAIRNSMIPVVTMIGLQFGFLLSGSIVVELVFSWPGVGRLMIDAIKARDYPVIQIVMLLFSVQFIFLNLLVDIVYAFLNPQISYTKKSGKS